MVQDQPLNIFLVTPFPDGKVDLDTCALLVEFQIANRSHGILVNGTTGEPSTLSMDERNALVKCAVEAARKRTTVVAQTGSQSHAETIALTEYATRTGVDMLLVLTPHFIRAPQRGVVEYYADVG